MKNILAVYLWFLTTTATFTLGIYTLHFISQKQKAPSVITKEIDSQNFYQIYASLPPSIDVFQATIIAVDSRPELIRQYLERFNSPLAPFAKDIITASNLYKTKEVDDLWRYIIAIAQCESNLGKKIPEGSYNAWGLGIPTGAKSGLVFNNWPKAINYTAKFLKKLTDSGAVTVEEWGSIYAPPSVQNGGSWAKCVRHFANELQ